MNEEIWKVYKDTTIDTIGRENGSGAIYEVSNLGRFKKNGIIEEPIIYKNGYYSIHNYLAHRVVAEAFIDNPENKPCIDHIDDNKLNNKADNLQWCTYSENNSKPRHRKLSSISHSGKKYSEETNKKKGRRGEDSVWFGKHHTEETKKKMSIGRYNYLKKKAIEGTINI